MPAGGASQDPHFFGRPYFWYIFGGTDNTSLFARVGRRLRSPGNKTRRIAPGCWSTGVATLTTGDTAAAPAAGCIQGRRGGGGLNVEGLKQVITSEKRPAVCLAPFTLACTGVVWPVSSSAVSAAQRLVKKLFAGRDSERRVEKNTGRQRNNFPRLVVCVCDSAVSFVSLQRQAERGDNDEPFVLS